MYAAAETVYAATSIRFSLLLKEVGNGDFERQEYGKHDNGRAEPGD